MFFSISDYLTADGTNLLKSARKQGVDTPILIITARGAVDDRVSGLDRGADDYLLKPFELRELTARMRALIRRRAGRSTSTLSTGAVELDTETHELRHGDAKGILSAREYALMHALMERPGRRALESRHHDSHERRDPFVRAPAVAERSL